jgi:hypothetical protein
LALNGRETWSLILREEHRLRVLENRVLRRMFGPKRDEVVEGWREMHNEELHNVYSSLSMIRMIKSWRMRWVGHVARMEAKMYAYRILRNPEGKLPLEIPIRRWVDYITIYFRGIEWGWHAMG